MEIERIFSNIDFGEIKQKIEALSFVYGKTKSEIIKQGILTNIAFQTMPNYKNYKSIISGITQARMIKGVNSKRNHIESQIEKLLEIYELDEINKDILTISTELVIITFDSIFLNSTTSTKKKYFKIIDDLDFLYINLKLAVKIIAETLERKNIQLSNMTLHYITEAIKKEKKDIAKDFINAYINGDETEIYHVKRNYQEKMEKMLDEYYKKIPYNYEHAVKIGEEKKVVETLGPDFLDSITSILLHDISIQIKQNNGLQLNFNDNILIK